METYLFAQRMLQLLISYSTHIQLLITNSHKLQCVLTLLAITINS